MGLPANTTLSLATANYLSSDKSWESLNTFRIKTKPNAYISFSADAGADVNFKMTNDGIKSSVKPAFELKASGSVPLSEKNRFNMYGRARFIGDTQQYRLSAGLEHSINDKLSIYGNGHYTIKQTQSETNQSYGVFVGVNYGSLWAEVQKNFASQNLTLNGWEEGQWMFNIGYTYKFPIPKKP